MKKLLCLTIFANLLALGSEQDQIMLSNKDTAQLLTNFEALPEEIKCMVLPEYSPELNAIVCIKKIPKDATRDDYWENLLRDYKKGEKPSNGYYSSVLNYTNNEKKYPLYIEDSFLTGGHRLQGRIKRIIGPNKNKIILLENYLFDLKRTHFFHNELNYDKKYTEKLYKKFIPMNELDRSDGLDRISPQALFLDEKFLLDQYSLCLHPTRDVFITRDVSAYWYKVNSKVGCLKPINHKPRINISRFDSASKKFTIISVNTPLALRSCVFDKSELSAETIWGIDTSNKLLRLTKNKDTYDFEEFDLEHPVVTIHQMRTDPTIVLINSDCKSYLYKIKSDRALRLIKTFQAPATFLQKDDNLSAGTKYQQEHVVIVKPLTVVTEFIQKQSAKALVDAKAISC